jgi:hypothetical protein
VSPLRKVGLPVDGCRRSRQRPPVVARPRAALFDAKDQPFIHLLHRMSTLTSLFGGSPAPQPGKAPADRCGEDRRTPQLLPLLLPNHRPREGIGRKALRAFAADLEVASRALGAGAPPRAGGVEGPGGERRRASSRVAGVPDRCLELDECPRQASARKGRACGTLLGRLRGDDRLAIVTYAGESGLGAAGDACASTASGSSQPWRTSSLTSSSPGPTGIELAYASRESESGGLRSDPGGPVHGRRPRCGHFGRAMKGFARLIEENARATACLLTALGFGMGSDKRWHARATGREGQRHPWIRGHSPREAERLMIEQVGDALAPIARDVRLSRWNSIPCVRCAVPADRL